MFSVFSFWPKSSPARPALRWRPHFLRPTYLRRSPRKPAYPGISPALPALHPNMARRPRRWGLRKTRRSRGSEGVRALIPRPTLPRPQIRPGFKLRVRLVPMACQQAHPRIQPKRARLQGMPQMVQRRKDASALQFFAHGERFFKRVPGDESSSNLVRRRPRLHPFPQRGTAGKVEKETAQHTRD